MRDVHTVEGVIRAGLRDRSVSYRQLAEMVRAAVDGANTTSRSVASTVSRLRKRGYKVPDRRYMNHA